MFVFKRPVPRLDSLSSNRLRFLQKCKTHYDNVALLYSGAYKDRLYVEEALRQAAGTLNSTKFSEFAEKQKSLRNAEVRYAWWLKTQSTLSGKPFWKNANAVSPDFSPDITHLNAQWQRHQAYSHFTSEAIYVLAFELLPSYEEHINDIAADFKAKKRKLIPKVAEEIEAFLTDARKFLKDSRKDIAYAMAARLREASEKQDLTYDDVTHAVVHKLQEYHVIQQNLTFPKESHGLTQLYFEEFHDFIASESLNNVDVLLKTQASWLSSNGDYQTSIHRGKMLIIPKELQSVLPKTRFQRWWQTITNVLRIDTWLAENRYLIAQCRILENNDLRSDDAAIQEQLQEYKEIRDTLTQKLDKIKAQKPTGILRFFRLSQYKRIKGCEAFLSSQCQMVADKFAQHIENQIASWEHRLCGYNSPLPTQATQEQQKIIADCQKLLGQLTQQSFLNLEQSGKLKQLDSRLNAVMNTICPPEPTYKKPLRELANGNIDKPVDPLFDYIKALKKASLYKKHELESFQKEAQPAQEALLTRFSVIVREHTAKKGTMNDETRRKTEFILDALRKLDVSDALKQSDNACHKRLLDIVFVLYGEYLIRLHNNEPGCQEWLAQTEILMQITYNAARDVESEQQIEQIKSIRLTHAANRATEIESYYQQHLTMAARKRCNKIIRELREKLWHETRQHCGKEYPDQNMRIIKKWITKAEKNNCKLLTNLALDVHAQSLFGLHRNPQAPLRYCNKILNLNQIQNVLDRLNKSALQAIESQLKHMKDNFDLLSSKATLLPVPRPSCSNPIATSQQSRTIPTLGA